MENVLKGRALRPAGGACDGRTRQAAMRAVQDERMSPEGFVSALPAKIISPVVESVASQRWLEQPTVFVSYSRVNIDAVRELITWLRSQGVAATWDKDIAAGADFRNEIQSTIEKVLCVAAVWSDASISSRFVISEVNMALRLNKLVTTHLTDFDVERLPFGFEHLNSLALNERQGILRSLRKFGA